METSRGLYIRLLLIFFFHFIKDFNFFVILVTCYVKRFVANR